MLELTLPSVFLVGLLGGVHCAGMCGGIVAVMGAGAARRPVTIPVRAAPAARPAGLLLGYNLGRLASYTALGAVAGALGSSAALLGHVLPLQQAAFVATNLLLVAIGLHLAGALRLTSLEVAGGGLWRRLQPLASRLLAADTARRAVAAGMVWGLVPCGMVYGVLIAALLSGSAGDGAALMLAFGAGTLPNLLLLGAGAAAARRWLARPGLRLAAGAVVAAFGVAGLLRLDPTRHLHRVVDACLSLF
jgi:sulfite exporter TauE/SafE